MTLAHLTFKLQVAMYEIFEHTADLGIRVRAATLPEVFAEAGRGLLAVMVRDPDAVRPVQRIEISLEGEDRASLLIDWLRELLFTFETRRMLLVRFDVRLDREGLSAVAWGEPLDPLRHELDEEVKAITYHGLTLRPERDGWLAEVIVDL